MAHLSDQAPDVVAAGVVVWRTGREVLLVHRPRYDDWSFPKGKLDPGEAAPAAAVREVLEETGLRVRLGPPLADQTYAVGAGGKVVHYWVGWVRDDADDDVSTYEPNAEIDQVAWVPLAQARERLTYPRDRATLAAAEPWRRRTRTLVVLRHGKATSRKAWDEDDRLRPLEPRGLEQAQRLVGVLPAWDVARLVSSSSTRCTQTLEPYADAAGHRLRTTDALTEEGATDSGVADIVAGLLERRRGSVLCTHRPVLPTVLAALGVRPEVLDPGGFVVVHHRKGRIVAAELWTAP